MSVIKRIKEISPISIKKLEETLGFGNGTISKWDKSSPKADKIITVAKYLNVSIDYLLTGNQQNKDLTELQKELLKKFSSLPEKEQYKILGKIELMLEQQNDEDLKTVEMLSDLDNITKSNNKIKTNI